MAEWFEDDDLWLTLEPALFGPTQLAKAPAEIDAALARLAIQPGAAVLDLPCGVGRHSLELARRGYRVTSVDRTEHYLKRTRETLAAAGHAAEVLRGDLRTFRRDGAFDAIVNLWTSFGYFEDPADDAAVMANFFASLKPGGRLLIDVMGREVFARIFRARDWRRLDDGTIMLEERRVLHDWTWVESRWSLIHDGRERTITFGHRVYTAADLKSLASRAGFADVTCFGSLAGTPYDHAAERLVLIATRPAGPGR